MRNKFSGPCYFCGKVVHVGKGHFERSGGVSKVIHAECVFEQRKQKAETRSLKEVAE